MKSLVNKKSFNIILVLLSGILWGCIGLFTTPLTEKGIDSISIIAVRSLLTAIFLFIFILIYNRGLLKVKLKDIWAFLGMGVISFSFFNLCYLKSMEFNQSLGTACILMYTAPIFIMLLSAVLFKEKITTIKITCLGIAILGCILISGGGSVTPIGFVFGIGSGIGYGLYSIFSVYALRKYHFFTSVFYAFSFSALSLIPFCGWQRVLNIVSTDYTAIPLFIVLALLITVIPYIIYTCGLRVVPASEASVIACIEPLIATLVGFFALEQNITPLALIGMGLILASVIILSKSRK